MKLFKSQRQTDRQTDKWTYIHTDRRTDSRHFLQLLVDSEETRMENKAYAKSNVGSTPEPSEMVQDTSNRLKIYLTAVFTPSVWTLCVWTQPVFPSVRLSVLVSPVHRLLQVEDFATPMYKGQNLFEVMYGDDEEACVSCLSACLPPCRPVSPSFSVVYIYIYI